MFQASTMRVGCAIALVAIGGCGGGETTGDAAREDGGRVAIDSSIDGGPIEELDAGLDASGPIDGGPLGDVLEVDASARVDPSVPGPYAVDASDATLTRDGRSITILVRAPRLAAGERAPLVVFAPGFQIGIGLYAGTLERLASHGFVVLGVQPPASLFSADHVAMAADIEAAIDWATGAGSEAAPFASSVDPERVGAAGHSLGGKLATLVALDDARVDALAGVDPVDGDPAAFGGGSASRPDLMPARGAELTIPVAFLGELTDASGGFMPCAPAAENFTQFYAATTSAPWAGAWTFVGANHMSFLDDPAACGLVCSLCQAATADQPTVLAGTRTVLTAFFRRTLLDDAAMESWLTSWPTADVTVERR